MTKPMPIYGSIIVDMIESIINDEVIWIEKTKI